LLSKLWKRHREVNVAYQTTKKNPFVFHIQLTRDFLSFCPPKVVGDENVSCIYFTDISHVTLPRRSSVDRHQVSGHANIRNYEKIAII